MDELLNLLRVNLCNCCIKDEDIVQIKAYIENGDNSFKLDKIGKYNMESSR